MLPKILFRRSMSSNTSASRDSSASSTSSTNTSHTSLSSSNDLSSTLRPSTPIPIQKAPLLTLPIELLQQITTYLDTATTASFSLSSRYICYSVGRSALTECIQSQRSKFEKRKVMGDIIERAFPGHWFCAWCDGFHAWDRDVTGPQSLSREERRWGQRDCVEFNSFLSAGGKSGGGGQDRSRSGKWGGERRKEKDQGQEEDDGKDEEEGGGYTLCYHHIRLAINHSLYGPQHGIPLSALDYTHTDISTLSRTPIPTKLAIKAKIINARILLHTTFSLILPHQKTLSPSILHQIWPLLPHILAGHRDSDSGHTGLMAAIDNVVRRNWTYYHTQTCGNCSTDWIVQCIRFPHATGGQVRLVVQSWRDLGDGQNLFEGGWRAHGGFIKGLERVRGERMRGEGRKAGDIRRVFEMGGEAGVRDGKMGRAMSPGRARIYRAFMSRGKSAEGEEDNDIVIRRSRARGRPRTWRTASENDEVERQDEEEQKEVARQAVEEMIRMDVQRLS